MNIEKVRELCGPHYKVEIIGQKVCMTKTGPGPTLNGYREYDLKKSDLDMTDMDFLMRICVPVIEMLNQVAPPEGLSGENVAATSDPDVLIH